MAGYTKLFACIVTSSIWTADDSTLRVWIAMLAMADADGVVEGSIPGFASLCRVAMPEMVSAVEALTAPDPYSRTKDHEGRRIEAFDGGWRILNYKAYRERAQDRDGSKAPAMRRYRARQREVTQGNALSPVVTSEPEERRKKREAVRKQRTTEAPPSAPPPDPPTAPAETSNADDGWNAEFADDFRAEYHARPPAQFFVPVKAAVRRFGWSAVRPVLREIMADTPVDYLNLPKVLAVKVEQSLNGHHPPARAGPSRASGSETMAALERFKARRQADAGSGQGDSVRGDADQARGRLPTGTE